MYVEGHNHPGRLVLFSGGISNGDEQTAGQGKSKGFAP